LYGSINGPELAKLVIRRQTKHRAGIIIILISISIPKPQQSKEHSTLFESNI
jgi:hypothetical protein